MWNRPLPIWLAWSYFLQQRTLHHSHIFSNRDLYIIQQDNDRAFLAQVPHCINQSIHLYLDSRSKNTRVNIWDNLLNHEEKRDLIEQKNFIQKLSSAIKAIFLSTNKDKENDKNLETVENTKVEKGN